MGIPQAEIDRIIADAARVDPDEVQATWVEIRAGVRITFTRRARGISMLYACIADDYAERRELRSAYRRFQRDFPIVGPITAILYIMLAIPLAMDEAKKEREIEDRIAMTRRLVEEIRWHNKNCEAQFKAAKTMLGIKLMDAEGAAIDEAWREFEVTCDDIMDQTYDMMAKEGLQTADRHGNFVSGVRSMKKEIDRTLAMRKPSLSDQIAGADKRHDGSSPPPQNEREEPTR